jgi:hypothetical protein
VKKLRSAQMNGRNEMVYALIAVIAVLAIVLGVTIYLMIGFAQGGRWKV